MLAHHSFCIILVFCLTSTVLLQLITVELDVEEKNVGSMYGHTSKQVRGKKTWCSDSEFLSYPFLPQGLVQSTINCIAAVVHLSLLGLWASLEIFSWCIWKGMYCGQLALSSHTH